MPDSSSRPRKRRRCIQRWKTDRQTLSLKAALSNASSSRNMCSVSTYRLASAVLASVPLAELSGRWWRRGRGLFRTGSGSRCASPDKRSTPSPSGCRTQTSLTQTRTCRQRAHRYCTGRVTSLRRACVRACLSQATLPVRVDGAFVELYGLLCLLQFSRGILKLGANSAETCVTLTDRQEETGRWVEVQQLRLPFIAVCGRSQARLPERCTTSGWVYRTTSGAGFLHSFERNSSPADRHVHRKTGVRQVSRQNSACHCPVLRRVAVCLPGKRPRCRSERCTISRLAQEWPPSLLTPPGGGAQRWTFLQLMDKQADADKTTRKGCFSHTAKLHTRSLWHDVQYRTHTKSRKLFQWDICLPPT